MKHFFSLLLVFTAILVFSCRKETFITSIDARVSFSADTLHFDTVFTGVGSITKYFKITNDNNRKLQISSVLLKGGASSPFKINVDGTPGPEVTGIEIAANDSVYVFVSVSPMANAGFRPFIVQDSIEINYNGNTRYVQLDTWGQNANFLRSVRLQGRVTWTNNLPYVITGGLQVDTNAVLTIEKGCQIFLHADAPLIVDGTLRVNGEQYDSTRVHFRSDRMDDPYRKFPAGWPGIYFRGTSRDNVMNYATVQNAYQGIVAEKPSLNTNPKVILNQCIIENAYDAGLLAVQSSVQANNCLFANCGKNIQLIYGGNYQFNHCTVAAYTSSYITHKEPVLFVANNIKQANQVMTSDMNAVFRNSIFWGEDGVVENEVVVSKVGSSPFSILFERCLWKVKSNPSDITASDIINGQDPGFDSINVAKHYYDFRLKAASPALNKGSVSSLSTDLNGLLRPVGLPDLGAYERQ
jgi:hypothetical protein